MPKTKPQKQHRPHSVEQALKAFCLFDDPFFMAFCQNEPRKVEYILRILMRMKHLSVIEANTKYDITNLKGRSLQLDVLAKDKTGKYYNIEVQRSTAGADPHRARYHMSLLDAEKFPKNQKWTTLPETWVIFITEKDYFKEGLAYYTIDRVIRQTGALFKDDGHILYVNGEHRGDDAIGRLMHDFACADYRDMLDKYIQNSVRMLKESEAGKEKVMTATEMVWSIGHEEGLKEGHKEGRKEGAREERKKAQESTARTMLADNEPLDKILKYSRMTMSALKKLCDQMGVPVPA